MKIIRRQKLPNSLKFRSNQSQFTMGFKILAFACFILAVRADKELFAKFQVDHNKVYQTPEEQEHRYQIFKENLQKIDEHNEKFEKVIVTWELGINQFADLTAEEFRSYLGTFPVANLTHENTKLYKADPLDAVPASIDWRQKGAVTAVKNQGNCGGCWSFSATGTVEGQFFTKKGKLVSLSEQQLFDCATENKGYSCNGCAGGVVQSALDYVRDHGLEAEATYPYLAKKETTCKYNSAKIQVKTKGYTEIAEGSENDLKSAVGLQGPVSVAVNADLWQHYKSGIFADTACSKSVNHGVLAVGYGSEGNNHYWIVKNSWTTSFGEKGYIRLLMGHNLCGIVNQACFPYF